MSSQKKKLGLRLFIISLSVWILFLALVPTLMSKGGLNYFLKKSVKGNVSFEHAKLSWFGGQTLENLTYKNKNSVLKISKLKTKASLLHFIFNRTDIKEVFIEGLEGTYHISEKTSQSLLTSLEPSNISSHEKPAFLKIRVPFTGKVHLDHSELVLLSEDYDAIALKEIQLHLNMVSKEGPLLCNLACNTSQNDLSGAADLNMELGGFNSKSELVLTPYDRDIFFLSSKGYIQLNAELSNLPSIGLDHLVELANPKLKGLSAPLFGDSLNLGSQLNIVKGKSILNLSASSPNFNLKFSGSTHQNHFYLDEASSCDLKITPHLMKALSKTFHPSSPLDIQDFATAEIHLDRLAIPLDTSKFNLNTLSCNAHFSLRGLNFTKDSSLSDLRVEEVNGVIDTFEIGENVTFHIKGSGSDKNNPFSCKADGQISKLAYLNNNENLEQLTSQCEIDLQEAPTRFLTFLSSQKKFYNELIGPHTNLNIKFEGSLKNGEAFITLNSSRLNLNEAQFQVRDRELFLQDALEMDFSINPSFAGTILNPNLSLLHPADVQAKLKELSFSLKPWSIELKDIDLKLTMKPFEAYYKDSKPIMIEDSRIYVGLNDHKKVETRIFFTAKFPDLATVESVDQIFQFSFACRDVRPKFPFEGCDLSGEIKNKLGVLQLQGKVDEYFNFHTTETPELLLSPVRFEKKGIAFSVPTPTLVSLDPISFSLKGLEFSNLMLPGKMEVKSVALEVDNHIQTVSDLTIPFTVSLDDYAMTFSTHHKNIDFKGNLAFMPNDALSFDIQGNLKKFPTHILSAWNPQQLDLKKLVGPNFNFAFNTSIVWESDLKGPLQYSFTSEYLHSTGELSLGKPFSLDSPLEFEYQLTPENYSLLQKAIPFENFEPLKLVSTTPLKLFINADKNQSEEGVYYTYKGQLTAESMITEQGELQNVDFLFESSSLDDLLHFNLDADTFSNRDHKGNLNLRGHLFGLKASNFKTTSEARFSCDFQNIPSEFLSSALPTNVNLKALGSTLDIQGTFTLEEGSSPILLDIQSGLFKTHLDAIYYDQALTLQKDLEIEFDPSKDFQWLNKINPFSHLIVSSEMPATLKISKDGFYLPLSPFDLKQFKISSGRLDIGKAQLKNSPYFNHLFSFLKTKSDSKTHKTWFTPLRFKLENGLLTLQNTSIQLDDSLHLLLLGDYDLTQNKNLFYLAIPGETLQSKLGLSNIPKHYLFKIPLSNTRREASLNFKQAYQRLITLGVTSSIAPSQLSDTQQEAFQELPWEKALEPSAEEASQEVLNNFLQQVKKKLNR